MSTITKPAEVNLEEILIDGVDVIGLFVSLQIFENIFASVVTGSVAIMDSDGAGFVEDNKIEFNEPFSFSATGAGQDNTLKFEGVLNGLRTESTQNGKRIYVIDFTTAELRKNEETFITKKFEQEKPEDVLKYVLEEKLEAASVDISGIKGQPMEFLGSRRKPFWVIKHVLTNGVVKPEAGDGQNDKKEEKELKGNTGFLCWQTLSKDGTNAFRGCDLDQLLEGKFETHTDYANQIMNSGKSGAEMMKNVVDYNFKTMGDIQSRMKSGAFKSKIVSYDMDTGLYKEFSHSADKDMTDKQKKIVTQPTRFFVKPFTNDKFAKKCDKAKPNTGDQSRDYMCQNNSRQNTFNDQTGHMTMYPQFNIHAGDIVEANINKTQTNQKNKMPHDKHSGKYVVKQILHHIEMNGKAYSKITILRSTNSEETQK